MDVYLSIRRLNATYLMVLCENEHIIELKKILAGITKVPPEDQRLYTSDDQILEDNKCFTEYGISGGLAKPHKPAVLKVAFRTERGLFEDLEFTPYAETAELNGAFKIYNLPAA